MHRHSVEIINGDKGFFKKEVQKVKMSYKRKAQYESKKKKRKKASTLTEDKGLRSVQRMSKSLTSLTSA